ncbi:endonuclease [Corynebacterium sp. 13CS0277]|uniref:DNA-formamidopyrimidine glycosylase family protein n=1 Tax=Corynebacterium sp. 13CS0277 TaxID=2071994 RepID=UPI000D036AE2|nr:DNA-formamidopyrimidine glycosylase family protein [Corynebacterium sp. 13CS0277]PRQ11019.1 endonuclease [Corynebacterium sp. 13CS0277]
MPEGDSVYQLARRLHPLVGLSVSHTSLRVPQLATVSLNGRVLRALWPYGKNLYMQFDEQILHTHLKMEGTWALHPVGTRWRAPGFSARVVLHFDAHPTPLELVGHDLGLVRLMSATDYPAHISQFGPDVLSPTFDHEAAARRLRRRPERAIGAALLDQSMLAGVGNEYRAEICFLAGVHPGVPTGEVDVDTILDITRRVMWANRLSPVRVTTGVRRAGETTYVFGRGGKPCRRCRTPIVKDTLGGVDRGGEVGELERFIWWCPTCQPTPPQWRWDSRLSEASRWN